MVCTVDGCTKPVKAKDLCGTHYQRQRRTGDPVKVRKAGRPRSKVKSFNRGLFPDWSPRTLDRWHAAELLLFIVAERRGEEWGELRKNVLAQCLRPNETISVARYLETAELLSYLDTHYPPNGEESVEENAA